MGCQVCSNNSEIKIEKNGFHDNILKSTKNLNYILYKDEISFQKELKVNEKKTTTYSSLSTHPMSSSNIIKITNYLENMRESMFNEINLIRTNPKIIEEKITKYYPFILTLNKEFFLQVDKNNKIKLNKGYDAFESCKNSISKKKPLQPLILRNDLTFPFPDNLNENLIENPINECIKENYLTKTLNNIKLKLLEKNIELVNFHYDIMNSNIELSVLLQIVDDTNFLCHRRKNLLSKSSKYIGINIEKIENGLYCYYLLFGRDSSKKIMKI